MSLLDDYVGNGSATKETSEHPNSLNHDGLAQFKVDPVTLPASLDIVCAVVKNNILVIAVANNKLLKIDLANPAEIQDLEVPKAKNEGGSIQKIHLDDTGSHLVISTTKGENWYLHAKLSKPAKLKTKGITEYIAWNPTSTSFSTKEILFGLSGGTIVETWLEPIEGFNKSVERYVKQAYSLPPSESICGLNMYSNGPRERHILLATKQKVEHFQGTISSNSGDVSVLSGLFSDSPGLLEFGKPDSHSALSSFKDDKSDSGQYFAWLNGSGVLHGPAPAGAASTSSFEETSLIDTKRFHVDTVDNAFLELSAFHILLLKGSAVFAFNRVDGSKVFQEQISTLDHFKGMMCDPVQQTFWLYSRTELFEIVITEEAQHMWAIFLKRKDYAAALRYAKNPLQVNTINSARAQALMALHKYQEAAEIYAQTSTPVEQVALQFLDLGERNALRVYLSKKLDGLKKSAEMQRTMLATWILELFMNNFSALDDLHNNLPKAAQHGASNEDISKEYARFIAKHKNDLDRDSAYALINSHGRQDELLVFAGAIDDHEYIINQYIMRDQFSKALELLTRHPDVELTYKTSTILLPEIPEETVEMWMRLNTLDPNRLLPAILAYNSRRSVPIHENQAVRYLRFIIKHQGNRDASVHNALIGIYARDCTDNEDPLISFLEAQGSTPFYDLDFALRQCKEHDHLLSCVHIYSSMKLYDQAVQWALEHDKVQLAGTVADRVEENPALRKKLWLMIAKKTIAKEGGIKEAIDMTKRNDVLRIEDLVPHFDEFTVIDDFKEEICSALEEYTANIENLRQEMDESSRTADTISQNIKDLKKRFAIIQVGEECYQCHRPLMEKQFYVFPCQHTFHSECLLNLALKSAPPYERRRLTQLQVLISRANATRGPGGQDIAKDARDATENSSTTSGNSQKELQEKMDELDNIVAAECLLCGSSMIKSIDEGFLAKEDKAQAAQAASWRL